MGKLELKATKGEMEAKPGPVVERKPFILDKAGPDDFFRLKRSGNGWVVEMVRLDKDGRATLRTEVWAWDRLEMTERRLIGYATDAERDR